MRAEKTGLLTAEHSQDRLDPFRKTHVKHKLFVVLIAWLCMLGAFSTDTYLPSFHSISVHFGVGMDVVQQTLTIYLVAMSVMTLFHGTLSDAFGRRPVILASVAVYTAASFGAVFAQSLTWLLICRLFQGLSVGAGMVVGRAMIRDRFAGAEAQKIMSYTTIVFGLAPVIAPILGGWLEVTFGWHSIFVFMTLLGAVLLAVCSLQLDESLPPSHRSPLHLVKTFKAYGRVMTDLKFICQSAALALSCSALYLYISSAPAFILQILHLPETSFAWLFLPMISGIMFGAFLTSRVAHMWTPYRIIHVGYGVMLTAAAVNILYTAFFPVKVPWAILPIMVCTFGMAFIGPAMTLLTLDLYPKRRGLAASLQSAFLIATFAAFSGFLAPLLFDSAFHLACGVLVGYVLSVTLWLLSHTFPHRPESHSLPVESPIQIPDGTV